MVALLLVTSTVVGTGAVAAPTTTVQSGTTQLETTASTTSTQSPPTTLPSSEGAVIYRTNVGGPRIAGGDGPDWETDDRYLVAGGEQKSAPAPPDAIHDSVPAWAPASIWEYQRWDPASGEEMQFEFDVQAGQRVEVRLYLYDSYSGTNQPGDRVFDVNFENQTFSNVDIVDRFGDQTGGMVSTNVTSDGTVDVDFAHVVENPQVAAIEVATVEPQPDRLGGRSSVDFGTVVTNETVTKRVTVTNLGGANDTNITLNGATTTGDDAFTTAFTGNVTLAPGESTTVPVTFAPTTATNANGTLEIDHSGSNSPMPVELTGEGSETVPVGFGLSGLDGIDLANPTSLDFGPDGRLYVAEMTGAIKAFTITREGPNNYTVTDTEVIDEVQRIPNHDDDGTYNPNVTTRQVTGITVVGNASNPVVYATSSDPRVGAGSSHADSGLDTNSGTVSRLTRASDGGWDHVMLVRGLPRSELNHATNDLEYDAERNVLYVGQGGHTNKGAPSDNFALTPEYALTAAVIEVDLDQLDGLAAKDAANSNATYLYDLPTLQGTETPFGGQDGQNMAMWTADSPVDVFAAGFRNPYDVALTPDGTLYATDNSANPGWGGIVADEGPAGICTNQQNEQDEFSPPGLYRVEQDGYYGHPNPTRGNPNSTFGAAVEAGLHDSAECDYRSPTGDSESAALEVYDPSPQGMDVYTASNFGGQMQGDLLLAMWNTGAVQRVELNASGTGVVASAPIFEHIGNNPLDVHAQGDDETFPGTVWAATYGSNEITVFEPNDYDGSASAACIADDPSDPAYDPEADDDGDGYTNGDENKVGTNPCSQASQPADRDNDFVPDSLDSDDDEDGLSDAVDPFAIDPANGLDTTLPVDRQFEPGQHPNSLFGLGFTGLLTDGERPYSALYNASKVRAGGAAEKMSVDEVPFGTALGDENSLTYGFQYGVAAPANPFEIHGTVVTPFSDDMTPENGQAVGIQFGPGDQDNYLSISATATDADGNPTGGVQVVREVDGVAETTTLSEPAVVGSGQTTDLYLTVDPTTDPTPDDGTDHVAVTAEYAIDGGQRVAFDEPFAVPASWVTDTSQGTAVGLVSTAHGASSTFSASWDRLSVSLVEDEPDEPDDPTEREVVHRVNAAGPTVAATDDGPDWSADSANSPSQFLTSGGRASAGLAQPGTIDSSVPSSTPGAVWESERWDPSSGDEMRYDFPVQAGETYEFRLYVYDSYYKTSEAGDRVYDLAVEGDAVTDFDVIERYGDDTGAMVSFTVTPTDDSLDVDFLHGAANNPMVNAIEVVQVGDGGSGGGDSGGPTADAGANQSVDEGTAGVQLDATGSTGDGLSYGWTVVDDGGTGVTLSDATAATPTFDAPSVDANTTLTFAVEVTDGSGATDSDTVSVTVRDTDSDEPAEGEVVYRVNAAGPTVSATDGGPDWTADSANSPSQYLTSGGRTSTGLAQPGTIDGSVPTGTPGTIWESERWDPSSGEEMRYDFPVQAGETYEVRLYVYDSYWKTSAPGDRVFDLAVEDESVTDFDVIERYGDDTGTVLSVTVTPSDDTLDVDFLHGLANNPMANAIEVVKVADAPDAPDEDEIVHRVNAAGSTVAATDGGPDWSADTSNSPSQYLVAGGRASTGLAQPGTIDASVPAGTPGELWESERWDPSSGEEMRWAFDAEAGETYEVRLYVYDSYYKTSNPGDRVFDVTAEGESVLTDFDTIDRFGDDTGGMVSFEVTPADDMLSVTFRHGAANHPMVNAIEVVRVDDGNSTTVNTTVSTA
ncbi:malectin domain-containing carbohydrate-binding protein [Haloarchaeobius sp. DFWS5]|uniref:malectin domain-containing carbohydrate-binding protein n=1 Tax=Haloarchaeobius sp. DFWS5 TaxID=3446114 RepID=UPI003EBE99EE